METLFAGTINAGRRLLLPALLLMFAPVSGAVTGADGLANQVDEEIRTQLMSGIQRARSLAELSRLKENRELARSAQNHADYLARHGGLAHTEDSTLSLFSGVEPEDRAVAAGYASRQVRELAGLNLIGVDSFAALMASVYHRLSVLNPLVNEIGIGVSRNSQGGVVYVINAGHSRWNQLCQQQDVADGASGRGTTGQCADNKEVPLGKVQSLNRSLNMARPEIILWPPDNSMGFPIHLVKELPPPLPGIATPGNALTVQIGTARGRPEVEFWQLLELSEDGSVKSVAVDLMTPANDRKQLLASGEYALLPLVALKYGTSYRSRLKYLVSGQIYWLEWQFTTRHFSWPVLHLDGAGELWVRAGEPWALLPIGRSLRLEASQVRVFSSVSQPLRADFEQVWPNPPLVRFDGKACARGRISHSEQPSREVRILPAEDGNPSVICLQRLTDSLPGLRIHGVGEVLDMKSGEDYMVSLLPTSEKDAFGRFRWAAPISCEVEVKMESELTAQLNIQCPKSGKNVRFSFDKERYFTVRIR